MAGEPNITVVGNLAGDPELRFTASGHAVVNLTIAQTPRSFDKQSNNWQDDETLWVRCTAWREEAENIAESLSKGMRVVAHGRLNARSFETKEGQQRTNWELTIDEIGPSLRWATAQVTKAQRNSNGGGGFGGYVSASGGQPAGGNNGGQPAGGQPAGGDVWQGSGQSHFDAMTSGSQPNNTPPPF